MNVLVLSHMFPTPLRPSKGIFVLEQIRALRELGVYVHVISPQPWAPAPLRFLERVRKYAVVPRQAVMEGFEVEYTRVLELPHGWLFSLYGWIYYLCCRRGVRRLLESTPVDLIHAHAILPDGFAAVLLAREFGLPTVCTLHGSDIRCYPSLSRATGAMTRSALKKVDKLIAVSLDLKQRAEQIAFRDDICVARNGADPEAFRNLPQASARKMLRLDTSRKFILFVGNLVPEKGPEFLLEAVAQLRRADVTLCMVGDGPLQAVLEERAHRLGLESCIFAGRRPHQEISAWLSAADCLVLPSLSEGSPTIISEAMQCRAPVVATRSGGTPEIVVHNQTGFLVPPADSTALACSIERMLHLPPPERASMLDRAERNAKQRLTWYANACTTLTVYEDALRLVTASQRVNQRV